MNSDTTKRLLEINRLFYQTFAQQFSATRQRLQPGVQQILKHVPARARILDLGCGNGELWRILARSGHQGAYVGLDFSSGLLAAAANTETSPATTDQQTNEAPLQATFLQADLSSPDWDASVREIINTFAAGAEAPFDIALAFAVLHHIPSQALRLQVLRKVHDLLTPGGYFYHSEWQFLNSARLRARLQPWENAGLNPKQLDEGDYLMDWRQGGYGLRYVHHFELSELAELANECGFRIVDTFLSDGEGGKLGLYQTWQANR